MLFGMPGAAAGAAVTGAGGAFSAGALVAQAVANSTARVAARRLGVMTGWALT